MPEFVVKAYRIREILRIDYDGNAVSFLIENGPDGSDDVTCRLPVNDLGDYEPPNIGDYWVNPFAGGNIVPKLWFERTYKLVTAPMCEIVVNGRKHKVLGGLVNYYDIATLAYPRNPEKLDLLIAYRVSITTDMQRSGILHRGSTSLDLCNGMIFYAINAAEYTTAAFIGGP